MSRLAPDGSFQDEGPPGHVPGSTYSPGEAATDVSAAPLWMAFRDHYTRAKERRHPRESIELERRLAPCL
jgi:hypothetical protein